MLIEMITKLVNDGDGVTTNHDFVVKQNINDTEENISDFHLFCISVVRDLINNESRINGELFSYDFVFEKEQDLEDDDDDEDDDEDDVEDKMPFYLIDTLGVLNYMSDIITLEKITFNKEFKHLLKSIKK